MQNITPELRTDSEAFISILDSHYRKLNIEKRFNRNNYVEKLEEFKQDPRAVNLQMQNYSRDDFSESLITKRAIEQSVEFYNISDWQELIFLKNYCEINEILSALVGCNKIVLILGVKMSVVLMGNIYKTGSFTYYLDKVILGIQSKSIRIDHFFTRTKTVLCIQVITHQRAVALASATIFGSFIIHTTGFNLTSTFRDLVDY